MMIGKNKALFGSLLILMSSVSYGNGCDAFIQEAEAASGVVPKLNDDGSIRAFVMYGEANFLVPKSSLVTKARQKAEMRAKRDFSKFLEENLQSEELMSDMLEQVEETNQDGMTSGTATEISQSIDIMRSSTSAVLSGIIKLDECVDTAGKRVLVEMGWKPSLSEAAADTKSKINSEVARGNANAPSGGSQSSRTQSAIQPSSDYRKKSSLKDGF